MFAELRKAKNTKARDFLGSYSYLYCVRLIKIIAASKFNIKWFRFSNK